MEIKINDKCLVDINHKMNTMSIYTFGGQVHLKLDTLKDIMKVVQETLECTLCGAIECTTCHKDLNGVL